MESLFFGADFDRYIKQNIDSGLIQTDVSNGLVHLYTSIPQNISLKLEYLDRMVMLVFVLDGSLYLEDGTGTLETVKADNICIFASRYQKWTMRFVNADVFVLFIADFFLKRYLCGRDNGIIDRLYLSAKNGGTLDKISCKAIDALSLYQIDKTKALSKDEAMYSLRGEQRIVEMMLHQFDRLGFVQEDADADSLRIAECAKNIVDAEFVDPPSIETIARRCATNTSKLKKVFKAIYQTTIYGYVRRLRMEEANMLLREERISISEAASRVGYRHQGHFSRLFYQTFGIYPKVLK